MHGARLVTARRIAERTFKNYNGFSPRNESQIGFHSYGNLEWTEDDIARMLGIYRKTRKPCSCYMCGNPRRHWHQLTRQELRQQQEADVECNEAEFYHKRGRWQRGLEE